MNILILGSEGFIGAHLVDSFLKQGANVNGCDLYESSFGNYHYIKVSRLSPEWDEIFSSNSYDVCINAAGSGNVSYSMTHPLSDFESNTLDVIRVLNALRRYNRTCKYLHISSAAVYGNPRQLPVKETDNCQPLSPYGWHKWMSEMVCKEYHHLYAISCCIIRPFSVYGPGLRKQLFWDLYQKAMSASEVKLFGTGNESRDFIYIDDLMQVIDIILRKAPMQAEWYNVATGTETLIRQAASLFLQHFPTPPKLIFNGQAKPGDPLNWKADISNITALGFQQQISLEKGLELTFQWINNQVTHHDR